ncbi:MAG TPA: DNA methyltransferase [Burkholderiales bacterium]|nr:DNA methyltransferase [Burkholderiales bacterium]
MSATTHRGSRMLTVDKLFFRMEREGALKSEVTENGRSLPVFSHSFWTPKQRQASSLQEISYRACFKPQLPAFFIDALSEAGDRVYDPFSGRGTTPIEAALKNRRIAANDINPLSPILYSPRLNPPSFDEIKKRLDGLTWTDELKPDFDLSMFYHEQTLLELLNLRAYLSERRLAGVEDSLDTWIRMVATNRLSGHSPGFFSVYTLPPNQAVLPERQRKINLARNQMPTYRPVAELILKKSRQLLRDVDNNIRQVLNIRNKDAIILSNDARNTPEIANESIKLTITSPPFLDIVHYGNDNWLRLWFNELDEEAILSRMTLSSSLDNWSSIMAEVFHELFRITCFGGFVAFEVGEVRCGSVRLEDNLLPSAHKAGFIPRALLINVQHFTKTANIWGIGNNQDGTLTNRIILLEKN